MDHPWRHSDPRLTFPSARSPVVLLFSGSWLYVVSDAPQRKSQLGIWSYGFCLRTMFSSSSSWHAPLFILEGKIIPCGLYVLPKTVYHQHSHPTNVTSTSYTCQGQTCGLVLGNQSVPPFTVTPLPSQVQRHHGAGEGSIWVAKP